jgi:hypothetical protein
MMFPVWSTDKTTKLGMTLNSPRHKIFRFQKSKKQSHIPRRSGNGSQRICSTGQTMNKEYYVEVLSRLVQRISKNSSSKTSVSGKRMPVPLAWQRETSHCSISTTVFCKTGDSRMKSPHILRIYPHQTFSSSSTLNSRRKGEDLETRRTLKEI